MISPELQSKIASWRLRAATNELSLEEMKEAVKLLRQGRFAAASAGAAAKRGAKKAAAPAADDMLSELDDL